MNAIAVDRRPGGNNGSEIAMADGMISAPLMPCRHRAPIRMAADGARPARRHQDDLHVARGVSGQRFDRQQRVIHDAEPVRTDHDGNGAQRENQVAAVEVLSQRA